MTNNFDHSDEESGLNAEDLKFFKNRAKFLGSLSNFADVDLSAEAKRKGGMKKLLADKKKNPSGFDALEAAEDAQATALRKLQRSMQNKKKTTSNGNDSDAESEEDEFDRSAGNKRSFDEITGEESQLGLPIRSKTGEWQRQAVKLTRTVKNASNTADNSNDLEESKEDLEVTAKAVDGNSIEMTFEEAKEKLALVAMEITEDVEENIGKLKELLRYTRIGMIKSSSKEEEIDLMRMGLITAVAVFKDILPDYSIRPLTEVEKSAKVSKEVRKQRGFEETLLRSYCHYVDRLEEILKTVKRGDAMVVSVAVGCLGQLAIDAGHFNHYERVLSALCGQVFNGKEHVSVVASTSLGKVFSEDEFGRSTAHALRLISDAIQARDYLPELRSLDSLQHVRMKLLAFSRTDTLPSDKRLASEEAVRLDVYKKKSLHMSKSQKKNLKVELSESIKSARSEAEFSREERSKWSSDALKFLFRILFGILKRFTRPDSDDTNGGGKTVNSAVKLLPQVMKCLSRVSQFLSVEYFTDLLSTLKKTISLIEAEQSLIATLHTIQTVLQIISLQETTKIDITKNAGSIIDLKFYFDLIYRQIPLISSSESTTWTREFESLFESVMSKLFLSKKHCPATRVAAFIHRFALMIQDPSGALPFEAKIYFLRLILRLLDRHEKTRGLLDDETLGVAAYLPKCSDPDLCNPFCKQLELSTLTKSIGGKLPADINALLKKFK